MFSSHVISRPKPADEYRVLLMVNSSTWGWLLENRDAYAANINAASLTAADGRRVVTYNLGYPIMSLTKDLMLLDDAMQYQPDQIVWLVTLASFPRDKQLFPPIVQNNAARVRDLIARYDLQLDPDDSRFVTPDFFGKTIIGQRRALAGRCACKPTACRGRRQTSIRRSRLITPCAARISTPICRGNRSSSRRRSPATTWLSTCWRRASSGRAAFRSRSSTSRPSSAAASATTCATAPSIRAGHTTSTASCANGRRRITAGAMPTGGIASRRTSSPTAPCISPRRDRAS
ncbi:MAG: hypothetical protein U0521_18545 [Anaerolineae bacterium]